MSTEVVIAIVIQSVFEKQLDSLWIVNGHNGRRGKKALMNVCCIYFHPAIRIELSAYFSRFYNFAQTLPQYKHCVRIVLLAVKVLS